MIDIEKQYNFIKEYYEKYLKNEDVKLPNLYTKQGKFSHGALVLVKLSEGYPNTKVLSKSEISVWLETILNKKINDCQEPRHLSMQSGWYIESGGRGDSDIGSGNYQLLSLEKPYPGYISDRRNGFQGDFESLKKRYNFRCATCGSKEGEHHLIRTNVITKLEKGHMNPLLPLEEGNIIPQCQICNKAYKNKWIFDATGRVIEIANTPDGKNMVLNYINNLKTEEKDDIIKLLSKK